LQRFLSTAVRAAAEPVQTFKNEQHLRGRLWAGVAYRFLEMGLVAGKSDAVAMVSKGIPGLLRPVLFLPSWEGFFGFGFGFGFGRSQASLMPFIEPCLRFKQSRAARRLLFALVRRPALGFPQV
jgi:hypothetical protein